MNRLDNLEKQLRRLPKPPLDKEKANQMDQAIIKAARQTEVHEKKVFKFTPLIAGITGISVFALFVFLLFSINGNEPIKKNEGSSPPPKKEIPVQTEEENTAKNVVMTWAEAVKERDGKIQYQMLSESLQKDLNKSFEQLGYVTGQSSPWMNNYEINQQTEADNKTIYSVTFHLASSTGDAGTQMVQVILTKENKKWVISGVSSDTDLFPYSDAKSNVDQNAIDKTKANWEQLTRMKRYEGVVTAIDKNLITLKVTRNLPYDTDPIVYPNPGYTIQLNIVNQGDAQFLSGKIQKGDTIIASVSDYANGGQTVNNGTFYSEIYLEQDGLFYDDNGKAKAFLDFQPVANVPLEKSDPQNGWQKQKSVDIKGSTAKVILYSAQKAV